MTFSELPAIIEGQLVALSADHPVTHPITDSRKVLLQEGTVFFAISGERHDGHSYIPCLYEIGVRQFVVEKDLSLNKLPGSNVIKTRSSIEALQKIAGEHRKQFSIPVVGVTGSNGKTIIKEWLYQLLAPDYNIVKSPGSYNSQIGVPLSVWEMQAHHQLGIFEAGISKPGEMKKLKEVIQPTLGIFSNIGTAHDENFSSAEHKAEEKAELFRDVERLIYCADHQQVCKAITKKEIKSLSWGLTQPADIQITPEHDAYRLKWNNRTFTLTLPFADQASVENAFHCVAVMVHLNYDFSIIQQRVNLLRAVPMRLELKEGVHQCQVVDDSYNNDLVGLQISLDFISHQQQKKSKTLILSDILQSGLAEEELTKRIAERVSSSGVQKFIGIGNGLSRHKHFFKANSQFYLSTDDFLKDFDPDHFRDEIILVKGARVFRFEQIIAVLQKKVHGTVMEVDLGALVHNLNFFKSRLKPGTKLMVMVKAFAYGSSSVEVANVLQYHQADYLGVAYADEGVDLRQHYISIPIMVMNPTEESFPAMMNYKLEPEIYSFKILHALINFLNGRTLSIHIKLDTGMHRLGFEEEDVEGLIELLKKNDNLNVASLFSHLAGSDEKDHDDFSREQGDLFLKLAARICTELGIKPIKHLLNTSGILRFPNYQLDMVRLGVGLYGFDPSTNGHPLKPVATLKTVISQIRKVKKGEPIGYSRKGRASKDSTIGTIAIGYADGYSRAFSQGKGEVLIKGVRVPVIGNVCMDMTMIDISNVDAKEGDEVIIFGPDLPISEVAARIDTIPYEILTNTSERVKRIFVAESM